MKFTRLGSVFTLRNPESPDAAGVSDSEIYCILYCILDIFACFSRSDQSIQYHRVKSKKRLK